MRELLIATKNPGKYREIVEALDGLPSQFLFLRDLDIDDHDFEEDGETFRENAYKKAKYYFDKTGILTLAEDSGIIVNALVGELGVKTRRWGAGEKASDERWLEHFMRRMENVMDRSAEFFCCACLYDGKTANYFEGETRGWISKKLEAPILEGIPLSSVFKPEGFEKAYATLTLKEKNKISHRGKAIRQAGKFLQTLAVN